MPKPGDRLNLSPIGATFLVVKTTRETNGKSLEMEWDLAPNSEGTPVHDHPAATESYEVLEGTLDVYVNGEWTVLAVGQKASVPPGAAHTFRNSSNARTRVYNTHAPAMRFGEYFETIHRIVDSGVVEQNRMTPKAMLYLSMVMVRFEREIRSVKPPQFVVKLAALLARSLGYKIPE